MTAAVPFLRTLRNTLIRRGRPHMKIEIRALPTLYGFGITLPQLLQVRAASLSKNC